MIYRLSQNILITNAVKSIRDKIAESAIKSGRQPEDVQLMAVTKTQPAELVNLAIHSGITLLGENRAQELLAKYNDYDKNNINIHFIGSLQRNKVRQIVDKIDLIQSVDSLHLAAEIDKRAAEIGKIMDVLIEVNIGNEQSKAGVCPDEALNLVHEIARMNALRLRGLMTIPPFGVETKATEQFFYRMYQLFVDIQAKIVDNSSIDILSMGMSDDFELAVKHGSTLCRIGSALFGARR